MNFLIGNILLANQVFVFKINVIIIIVLSTILLSVCIKKIEEEMRIIKKKRKKLQTHLLGLVSEEEIDIRNIVFTYNNIDTSINLLDEKQMYNQIKKVLGDKINNSIFKLENGKIKLNPISEIK